MLGWHVSVYRLEGTDPAFVAAGPIDDAREEALRKAAESPGSRIAVWQTGLHGLDWIDELVRQGRAIALPGVGYPDRFFALARDLLTPILDGPPHARAVWGHDPGDVLVSGWEGRTAIDRAAAALCAPQEWLLVEAWDES